MEFSGITVCVCLCVCEHPCVLLCSVMWKTVTMVTSVATLRAVDPERKDGSRWSVFHLSAPWATPTLSFHPPDLVRLALGSGAVCHSLPGEMSRCSLALGVAILCLCGIWQTDSFPWSLFPRDSYSLVPDPSPHLGGACHC